MIAIDNSRLYTLYISISFGSSSLTTRIARVISTHQGILCFDVPQHCMELYRSTMVYSSPVGTFAYALEVLNPSHSMTLGVVSFVI